MQKIRVLIVDDESLARDTVRMLLEDRSEIEIVGECEDGAEAVKSIRNLKPDLVFLDIQMPELNGFGVLEQLHDVPLPVIIFATAFDEYALRAFDVHAIDYLLKPFDDDRFETALKRAMDRIKSRKARDVNEQIANLLSDLQSSDGKIKRSTAPKAEASDVPLSDRIAVKHKGALLFVQTTEIDWIEAAGDYVMIHTGPKSYLLRETMHGISERLPATKFLRVHRSSIINADRIKEIHPHFNGAYVATLKNGKQIRISRRYWAKVEKFLGA